MPENQIRLGALTCFCSERYIITTQINGCRHKVLQVFFGKKDGSLYVNFPYFQHNEGLVSLVTYPANIQQPTDLSLIPGGKATSHLVKYSHHPDGTAHFSQDGRVFTSVRKQSVPLARAEGHIFTVQVQGMADFGAVDSPKDSKSSKKRTVLNFKLGKEPEAVKIVGRWYSQNTLEKNLVKGTTNGPKIPCITPQGKKYLGFLIAHPYGLGKRQFALLLTCESIPILDRDFESALTFIGGFDSLEVINDLSVDSTFLALSLSVR